MADDGEALPRSPRVHGWARGLWLRFRDWMCGRGLHWPLAWEPGMDGRSQELLCQRRDCRYRLRVHELPPPPLRERLRGRRRDGG